MPCRPQVPPGLDLVPADPLCDPQRFGRHLDRTGRGAARPKARLEDYDLVLLETPPSLDGLLLNALCAAGPGAGAVRAALRPERERASLPG